MSGHARWASNAAIARPGEARPAVLRFVRRVLYPVVRVLYHPRVEGLANLPSAGPFLLVANHSGGIAAAEIFSFAALWARAFEPPRPIAGFALPIAFRIPGLRTFMRGLGAIPSTYEAARTTLAAGVPMLLFPGGDHEALRPLWLANRVDLAGRTGFLKIAKEAHVPIVPMGIRGSHLTLPIFLRARWLATFFVQPRLIGTKRWVVTLSSVVGAACILGFFPFGIVPRLLLAYLWLGSPFVVLPILPARIRFSIGAPIPPSELFAADDLPAARDRVQRAMQAEIDRA